VVGTQTWRLADLGSKHMLLKEGIGWGYMPEPMVREDVEGGRLVHLDMPELKRGSLRLYAIYRTDTPPGPAGSWLISRFEAQAAGVTENSLINQPSARQRPIGEARTPNKEPSEIVGTVPACRSEGKRRYTARDQPVATG